MHLGLRFPLGGQSRDGFRSPLRGPSLLEVAGFSLRGPAVPGGYFSRSIVSATPSKWRGTPFALLVITCSNLFSQRRPKVQYSVCSTYIDSQNSLFRSDLFVSKPGGRDVRFRSGRSISSGDSACLPRRNGRLLSGAAFFALLPGVRTLHIALASVVKSS